MLRYFECMGSTQADEVKVCLAEIHMVGSGTRVPPLSTESEER